MISKEDFKEALRTAVSYEFADIPQDIPEHTFSPQFERKMNKLIASVNKRGKAPLRAIHKTALIAVASLVLLITVAYKVDAIDPIINFFTKANEYYVSFSFDKNVEAAISCEYELTYVPEDFTLSKHHISPTRISSEYNNSAGKQLYFEQKLTSGTHTVYMPKPETQIIVLDDITIYVRLGKSSFTAYWKQDIYWMQLQCDCISDINIITDMLKSITPIK